MIRDLIEVWQCLGGFALPLVVVQSVRITRLRRQINFKRDIAAIFIEAPNAHGTPKPLQPLPQKGISHGQSRAGSDSVV